MNSPRHHNAPQLLHRGPAAPGHPSREELAVPPKGAVYRSPSVAHEQKRYVRMVESARRLGRMARETAGQKWRDYWGIDDPRVVQEAPLPSTWDKDGRASHSAPVLDKRTKERSYATYTPASGRFEGMRDHVVSDLKRALPTTGSAVSSLAARGIVTKPNGSHHSSEYRTARPLDIQDYYGRPTGRTLMASHTESPNGFWGLTVLEVTDHHDDGHPPYSVFLFRDGQKSRNKDAPVHYLVRDGQGRIHTNNAGAFKHFAQVSDQFSRFPEFSVVPRDQISAQTMDHGIASGLLANALESVQRTELSQTPPRYQ